MPDARPWFAGALASVPRPPALGWLGFVIVAGIVLFGTTGWASSSSGAIGSAEEPAAEQAPG